MFLNKKYPYSNDFNKISFFPTILFTPLLSIINKFLELLVFTLSNELKVDKLKIKSFDDELIDLYIVGPKNTKKTLPCIVYCHGGGFVKKAGPRHFKLISEYIKRANCKMIYVDYRLAPKYKYPTAVKDCFEAYKYVLEHTKELNIIPNKIVIGGDSAGGNLAIGTTLMARDYSFILPEGMLLVYPAIDRRMQTESMKKFIDTPIWNSKLTKIIWNWYLGDIKEVPIYASILENNNFIDLPKTYLEVAEFDCLHDEGVELANRLLNDGISVEFYDTKETIHGYDKELNSEITRKYMLKRSRFLKGIFGEI